MNWDQYFKEETTDQMGLKSLKKRVCVLENGILGFHEIPHPSPFSVKVMAECLHELAENSPHPIALIIDLSVSSPPNKDVRQALSKMLAHPKIGFVAAFTQKNVVITTAARLLMVFVVVGRFDVVREQTEALKLARDYLRKIKTGQSVESLSRPFNSERGPKI